MPNMPKMPKLHKPAFLKKKKTDGEAAPDAEGDAPAEGMFTKMNSLYQIRSKMLHGTKVIILVEKNRKRGDLAGI